MVMVIVYHLQQCMKHNFLWSVSGHMYLYITHALTPLGEQLFSRISSLLPSINH